MLGQPNTLAQKCFTRDQNYTRHKRDIAFARNRRGTLTDRSLTGRPYLCRQAPVLGGFFFFFAFSPFLFLFFIWSLLLYVQIFIIFWVSILFLFSPFLFTFFLCWCMNFLIHQVVVYKHFSIAWIFYNKLWQQFFYVFVDFF